MTSQFDKKQMKLGIIFVRNHLISAYRAGFIDSDKGEFVFIMVLLTHVADNSADSELMMDDVISWSKGSVEWLSHMNSSEVIDDSKV